ncbi:unnamed protein product [Caenorhabditis brenneri]
MYRLLLVFLANLCAFPFSTGDYSMIEVYGIPVTYKSVNENPELNWKQCIQFCWNTPLCVLAFNKKADGCQWFVHDNITTVKQMKKANGYIVAFKINATSSTCLTGTNPPTFNNESVTGSATLYYWDILYGVRFNYTISLANDRWTFTFNYKFACPSFQYAFVQRANALDYCFLLGLQNVAKNQASAQTLCGMYNKSVITGVTTLGELSNVKSMMQTNRELLVSKDYLVRVDGKRTTSCQATPTTKNCMSLKGFTFSDPLVTTIDTYTWATNSGARATATSDCIVLVLKGTQPIVADVQSCNTDNPLPSLSFMCGQPAWNY